MLYRGFKSRAPDSICIVFFVLDGKHTMVSRTFDPSNEVTRVNSIVSRTYAVHSLYKRGCRRVAMFATPGSGFDHEKWEEQRLRESFDGLDLQVFCYENSEIDWAERWNLTWGCMLEHCWASVMGQPLHPGDPDISQYDGVIIEWDGTGAHTKHLENGQWTWLIRIIRVLTAANIPVSVCYTHSPKADNAGKHWKGKPPWYPSAQQYSPADYQFEYPWEGYLVERLTKDIGSQTTCLWSSRNYHREQLIKHRLRMGKAGCPMYRWVFEFGGRV